MGRIPHTIRFQRRVEVHVRNAAVAVVGDAHVGVQPRLVVVVVLQVQLDVDADLLACGHGHLRQQVDIGTVIAVELDFESVRLARIGQQLLGLDEVLLPLRHRLVGRGVRRSHRAIVTKHAESIGHTLQDGVAVEREREGLAKPLVGERALIAAHMQLEVATRV